MSDAHRLFVELADQSWRDSAACRGKPRDWFFPPSGGSAELAKMVCAGCPVRVECGEYGASQSEGVWGGQLRGRRR